MGKITAFANQKGGVGKTTTAANLGAYLAQNGKRVLLVDFDPQGNLTSSVGCSTDGTGIYEVMSGEVEPKQALRKTAVDQMYVIPSSVNLSGANIELANEENREQYLREALDPLRAHFDYLFVDCPPSLGILTLNGLVAADNVIVPLQCEYFAMEGLTQLLESIGAVQKSYNKRLAVFGIVFTMYDGRTRLAQEVVEQVLGYFGDKVFRTIIPRNVRLSEAPSHGVPISLYDRECSGARAYEQLAREVMARG